MRNNFRLGLVGFVFATGLLGWVYQGSAFESLSWVDVPPKPVDVTMHDFMEGVFQSPYRRLKQAMATEPTDNAGWKALRSDALILAEGGNLLLFRKPEKNVDDWVKYSVDSRDAGAELVKEAKKKNFAGARAAYEKMLTHCNGCHKQFFEGKQQLAP